jgi:tape measure domain-containing protein
VASIDNRVVSISFDNVAFQKNVSDTIAILDGLKAKLNFGESTAGFSDLTKASQAVNLSSISSAVDTIASKFSAMGAIAFTALQNITNRAIDAGIAVSKSFTLAPVTQGYQEYELKIGAIQTIMAGTGETLDVVNGKLQELNAYSDQTIYSFADMTQNIGKFTNAGVSLGDSVAAIKGIANVAALSGANAQEASRSMYNFGQAMSAGTIRNIDWKSIELANMATVGFKDEIIKTAVELGTLTKTSDGYETSTGIAVSSTKGFTQSLEEEWFTADVLTQTLNRYSDATTDVGERATRAATEVKTFSQLIGTVKEAIGSGWSASFEIFIGTFDEAKALLTEVNDAIGGFVGRSAEARNELLSKWKALGGRTILIQGLRDAFKSLGTIFKPIQEAFREVFPKKTAEDLLALTKLFAAFTKRLAITGSTAKQIKSIFSGVFSIFKLGIDIVKGIAGLFLDIVSIFTSGKGSSVLAFFSGLGENINDFREQAEKTKAIPKYFEQILEKIIPVVEYIKTLFGNVRKELTPLLEYLKAFVEAGKDVLSTVFGMFGNGDIPGAEVFYSLLDRIKERFSNLNSVGDGLSNVSEKVSKFLDPVKKVLSDIGNYISNWMSELGTRLSDSLGPGDFDSVIDLLNVVLLGGIAALLTKFVRSGFKLDFGNGLLENISQSFEQLTGTLSAMQTNLKAEALLKIAGAIAILTASVLVLSLIDSGALTKALGAMAVGFGQLIGAFAVLNIIASGTGAAKLPAIAAGLILLSTAILILSLALKILSTMSWNELAKGLTSITVLLTGLTLAVKFMSANSKGMMRAGLGLIFVAVALNLLALSMKIFATMSWQDIGKGFTGVIGGLVGIALAMQLMPKTLPITAAGLVLVGFALNLIAASMLLFSTMSWESIAKGIVGIAGGLLVIALAMNFMPATLLLTASGLVLVGYALNLIAASMLIFATMSWEEIGKGLTAMAGALIILAVAANAMTGAIFGAVAIGLVAVSLLLLTEVLKEMSKLSLKEIGMGLLGIAGVLGVLAIAAFVMQPLIGSLLLLSLALLAIGAGIALFGLGASMVAKAFEVFIKAGEAGIDLIGKLVTTILAILPEVAMGLVDFALVILDAAPVLIEAIGIVIDQLLKTIIELAPRFAEAVVVLIEQLLMTLDRLYPKVIQSGIALIMALLNGITKKLPDIISAVTNLVVSFINGISEKLPDLIAAGANFIVSLINGISEKLPDIIAAGTNLIVQFITGLGAAYGQIVTAGFTTLMSFIQGISENIQAAIDQGFEIVIEFLNGVANSIRENRRLLAAAGFNLLDAIFGGVLERVVGVASWFGGLVGKVIGWIGDTFGPLVTIGYQFISGMFSGIVDRITGVMTWFKNLGTTIFGWIGDATGFLFGIGQDIVRGLWNGILDMKDWLKEKLGWLVGWLPGWVKDRLGIESPSKVFAVIGTQIGAGLGVGMISMRAELKDASYNLAETVVEGFNPDEKSMTDTITRMITAVISRMENMDEFNPTITPVLDLTGVNNDAKALKSIFGSSPMSTDFAYNQARVISNAESERVNSEAAGAGTTEVNFNQTINAPTPLSTNDIYRQTRSQIALAKKELSLV